MQDLAKNFAQHGYFFEHNFEPLSNVSENFYDYFVVRTESARAYTWLGCSLPHSSSVQTY